MPSSRLPGSLDAGGIGQEAEQGYRKAQKEVLAPSLRELVELAALGIGPPIRCCRRAHSSALQLTVAMPTPW